MRAKSPDGRNVLTLTAEAGLVQISVTRDSKALLEAAPVGPDVVGHGALGRSSHVVGGSADLVDESFTLPAGSASVIRHRAQRARVDLETDRGLRWTVEMQAADDGAAFRYSIPSQDGLANVEIADEATAFGLTEGGRALYTGYDAFTSSHEALFRHELASAISPQKLLEMPLLVTWPGGPAAALAEAGVRDFAGMYLSRSADEPWTLRARLSPHPRRPGVSVAAATPLTSPWRVVLLADRAGAMHESNLLAALNDPPPVELGDFSWVQPGKTTFHWWNGSFEELYREPGSGAELAKHKRYIDFCAKHGIRYHSVTGDGRPWYVQREPGYAPPHSDSDILTPRVELHLPEIVEYAGKRGVKIRLWVHWSTLQGEMLERAFALYESWGIAGLMVDFLDRDDQEMNQFVDRLLQSAARHRLHIQIHGSPKPTGERRTYPHLMNREGVLNLEYLKWGDECSPAHNVNVAFTRALAGSVDYHLGGFRAAGRTEFAPVSVAPRVLGTRCHQLALYVVFENPLPMAADEPEAYEGQPGFDFLASVPTTWDETRFVAGEPGEFLVLARRKGDAWYVGGVTNWTPRQLDVPLEFLGAGRFAATLYADGSLEESQPNAVAVRSPNVDRSGSVQVALAPGGGFVASIRPEGKE